jgi:hypothetical protein
MDGPLGRQLNIKQPALSPILLLACTLGGSCMDSPGSVPQALVGDRCWISSIAERDTTATLKAPDPPPCRVQFAPTGTTLQPGVDGSHPDPGRAVVRDSRGLFYTTNAVGFPGVVAVWDTAGRFLHTIGGPGEGPGEFSARGGLFMIIDHSDQLHVRDSNAGWSVFARDHSFLRRSYRPDVRVFPDFTVMLDDGRIVSGLPNPGGPGRFFTAFSERDEVVRSFASNDGRQRAERPLAAAGRDQFWAGPSPGDPDGYVLELWNADGELLRSLRRDVPWFAPRDEQLIPPADGPRPPTVGMLHYDRASELLTVFVGLPSNQWRWLQDPRERSETEDELYDGVIDVIDTRRGVVIASERMSISEVRSSIRRMFPGIRQGYRLAELPSGLPVVEIMTYVLLPR